MSQPILPMPPARVSRKPVWKRWWFWAGAVLIFLFVLGSLIDDADTTGSSTDANSVTASISPTSSPEVTDTIETSKVPDLVGLRLPKATTLAQHSGFDVEVDKKYSTSPAGTILSMGPASGTRLEEGSTVRLIVAQPLPRIPNVVGDKLKPARRALEAKGFKVQVKKQAASQPKDTVISQSPAAGTAARPGRTVTLVVAKPASSTSGDGDNCTPGYSPCVPLGPSDYDCYGGSGDGPAYTEPGVTYRVTGSDPYGLDADGNGYGCE